MANVGFVSDFWDQSSHELCGGCMVRRLHLLRFLWRKCVSDTAIDQPPQVDRPATVLHPHVNRWFLHLQVWTRDSFVQALSPAYC